MVARLLPMAADIANNMKEDAMNQNLLRRVVTGHDGDGRAVVTNDAMLSPLPSPTGDAAFTLVWTTASTPADNNDATDGRERAVGLSLPGGTVLRVVDLLPGRRSAMHRTNSLDYGFVLSGTIELELDDGNITLIEAGAVIIQRGTIHAWRNPSQDITVRVAFVLIDANPANVDGKPLPPIMPEPIRSKT
jgi:quercetin dioxygenase-like cupin family protein